MNNLQISDYDLIGNKFNGHDLHIYLRKNKINSYQLVWSKESSDKYTFVIAGEKNNRNNKRSYVIDLQSEYCLNNILNPITLDILYNRLFLNADIIHFHLIHNWLLDLNFLPIISRLKPIVWTLHDPWALGGHCIHHFDCVKWQSHCFDCPYLNVNFPLNKDNSALNFQLKKLAIQNSNFDIIVASKWMEKKVRSSPIFKGKNIYVIPFGIDQSIFKPQLQKKVRRELNIPEDAFVITFRCDASQFKGLDYIEYVLKHIKTKKRIFLNVLANNLKTNPQNFEYREYGWVKDDKLLAKIYNSSDLFLMPSTMEAFGMMAIEAMSCGVLPIVLDGTSLPEVVNANQCGISVAQNKDAYLEVVDYYLHHDLERKKRERLCLKYAREKYNKERYVNEIIKLYKEVIKNFSISPEDELILNQLKKHMSTIPVSEKTGYGGNLTFWKKAFILTFYKIDKIVPKRIRQKAKPKLLQIKFINSLLDYS